MASHDAVASNAQEFLWESLGCPVDLLKMRQALGAGASPDARQPQSQLVPLEMAVDAGSLPACQILIEHGAVVDVRAVEDGRGLIHRAIAGLSREDRHPLVDYLLDAGVDQDALTDQGQSPLDWARMWDDQDLVIRLRKDWPDDTKPG